MQHQIPSIFMRFPEGRAKALTFSYDDGLHLDRRLIQILDAHHMKGTFNVNGGRFASEEEYNENLSTQRMTVAEFCQTFADSPHEVAIHGYSHCFMDTLPPSGIAREVLSDREALEELLGRPVHGMAYPFGAYNDTVVRVLRECGISYSRVVNSSLSFDLPRDWLRQAPTCHHGNPRAMELAKQFVEMNVYRDPQLFYLWGHTFEFAQNNNWHLIEEFTDYMAGREDSVWYATNIEIFEYVRDFGRLEYSADCSLVHNPTCRTLWLALSKQAPRSIAPGETVKLF